MKATLIKRIPSEPDELIIELLSRANLFLSHAVHHSNGESTLDNMVAIHDFDNTIEFILKIISLHLDIGTITGKNLDDIYFSSLASEINIFLKKNYYWPLPYFNEIKNLHKIRNLVQHGSLDPLTDLKRWRIICTNFFDKVLLKLFNLTRDQISIANLITNTQIKKLYKKAEKYFKEKKYLEAVITARDVFENALYYRGLNSNLIFSYLPAYLEFKEISRYTHWFFEDLVNDVELTKLGIEMGKYNRFKEYIRHIPSEYNVEPSGYTLMQRPWNKSDGSFCISFVSDLILKCQTEEFSPIYTVSLDNEYTFKMKIGNISFSEADEIMSYIYHDENEMSLKIIGKDLKEKIDKLQFKKIYKCESRRYKDGILDHHVKYSIKIKSFYTKLITNNPPRWQFFMWFENQKDFKVLLNGT